MIDPHGGKLINRELTGNSKEKAIEESNEIKGLTVHRDTLLDIGNIATGAFSPLNGFVLQNDFISIIESNTLENGIPWTIPVTFPVQEIKGISEGDDVALFDESKRPIAILHLEQIYKFNFNEAAKSIFGTIDLNHPGVKKMYDMGNTLLGGEVDMINVPSPIVGKYELTPEQTRQKFKELGWKRIVGFQTRNVPHTAHEYLQKAALELTDGILLHPLIGWKKKGDYKPETIMKGYEALIKYYYPKNRAVLSALTTQMRYAGPKEAVFHAIIRKNFGCTHFIVGRDHAGVGKYYDKYAAHKIFDTIGDIEIEILKLMGPYFCKHCGHITTEKTCPHPPEEQIQISGTVIRDMLSKGEMPPKEFMREEISKMLSKEDLN
ncbi:MAG: sulfate adenylyltransferase [Nanoarchaeota archaeon]|nr:sulfate adenylyltransferase [Nanoarchaeota archaeon]MBU1005585.1 sulfate adenylyltransferase [Nanoarchaeota archaeon]MBU1945971.1 sulfate adenylyltransferase [Nanoarchaeota archaeon]